jgi:hypothetical protein
VTADGLTSDSITNESGNLSLSSTQSVTIRFDSNNDQTNREFNLQHDTNTNILTAYESGDISFYDSTGVTQGFYWDASTQRLGLGTTSPQSPLHIVNSSAPKFEMGYGGGSNADHRIAWDSSGLVISADQSNQSSGASYLAMAVDGSERMRIDSSGNVGIGINNPVYKLVVSAGGASGIEFGPAYSGTANLVQHYSRSGASYVDAVNDAAQHRFKIGGSDAMRIDSSSNLLVGKTATNLSAVGIELKSNASAYFTRNATCMDVNRLSDGSIVNFYSASTLEGSISVSGTTVSYIGGHLSRWSRLADDSKDTSIVKGTVMTNLDEMVEWSHETTYWTDEDELPVDEDGNPTVSVGDVKTAAYVEDNEQLNKMAVSSVEGDANVAGVFVNWDSDDDEFNDMNIAMTGDMVIRIASGTTVARGDLLMSAGDGTAKPQGDDIVRSKTIAKVTSTHVSHTYDDGSYLVPCVLMAC